MLHQFELVSYGRDAAGPREVEIYRGREAGAKAAAGRKSRRIDGPVDLAFAGAAEWEGRYITTASPSEYHAAGYRFERLT